MCGRYVRKADKQAIAEAFRVKEIGELALPPDFNVAPTTHQPVIRNNRDTGERELVLMRWGLVPYFAKSLADFKGFSTINARADTLLSRAMWRVPFERRRCLIPADAFYEWKTLRAVTASDDAPQPTDNKALKPVKQPFAFSLDRGQPFAFAGLWDAWKDHAHPDTWLQSFTIITTDANETVVASTGHNRMPVILHARDFDRWLYRDPANTHGLGNIQHPTDLLRPFEAAAMRATPANPLVGNVRNNGPHLLTQPVNSA